MGWPGKSCSCMRLNNAAGTTSSSRATAPRGSSPAWARIWGSSFKSRYRTRGQGPGVELVPVVGTAHQQRWLTLGGHRQEPVHQRSGIIEQVGGLANQGQADAGRRQRFLQGSTRRVISATGTGSIRPPPGRGKFQDLEAPGRRPGPEAPGRPRRSRPAPGSPGVHPAGPRPRFCSPGLAAPGFPEGIAGEQPVPGGQGAMRRRPDRRRPP